MSQTGFAVKFEEALGELEALTAALDRSDPDELTKLGELLVRRHHAVAAVTSQLDRGARLPQEQAARLSRAWQGGQLMEERLKLVAAGARHHLQELYRAAWHTRALAADLTPTAGASRSFELEA